MSESPAPELIAVIAIGGSLVAALLGGGLTSLYSALYRHFGQDGVMSPASDFPSPHRRPAPTGEEEEVERSVRAAMKMHSFAGCVPADTMILMSDHSLKPVQAIERGDRIRSYDTTMHVIIDDVVQSLFRSDAKTLMVINRTIRITPSQDVLCDGMYRVGGELRLGQALVDEEHRAVPITSLEQVRHDEKVFSIILASGNGYYVRGAEAERSIIVREGHTSDMKALPLPEGDAYSDG